MIPSDFILDTIVLERTEALTMTTTPAHRCSECGSPLPPVRKDGGRPPLTCEPDASPEGRRCRRERENRIDESRREHRYAASRTGGDLPSVDEVLPPAPSEAERLAAGGFHDETPSDPRNPRVYLDHRRQHLDAVRRQEALDEAERRLTRQEAREDREATPEPCRILTEAEEEDLIRSAVARRVRQATRNPDRSGGLFRA